MKPPFRLVPDTLSTDTIQCLSELLEHAKNGQVIGLAFAAIYKGRRFIVNAAGECHRNPRYTRALVDDLHDALGQMCRERERE
jgi:hypothetical protein